MNTAKFADKPVDVRAIVRSNLPFFFPYFIFLLIGAFLLAFYSKAHIHLGFNAFHHPLLDPVLWAFTYLGDGVAALLVVIMLLAVNFRAAFIVAVSNFFASSFSQILKHTLLGENARPVKFFENIQEIYLVPGVENHLYNSFPSGHTTCAFALYLALTLIVRSSLYKILFFVLAFTVGYSRIYLSQHFFMDVYAGSLIGVGCTVIVFYFVQKNPKQWHSRSLITVFKK